MGGTRWGFNVQDAPSESVLVEKRSLTYSFDSLLADHVLSANPARRKPFCRSDAVNVAVQLGMISAELCFE